MASQPPAGSGPMPASSTGPDRGSGAPLEPSPTSRAKRRRDTEAQLARLSLVGSQPDASTTTPLTAKGPSTVFACIPEEGLTAARKHAPFALRRKVCQAPGLQLADIPHIYYIATGYSLRPLNKQVQQALLTDKQKLADSLRAYRIKTPTKWFTYVVPRCPAKL
ncbi:hypothetical protein CGCA056_v014950 [Colletotrichum aenigma]|uniref:uncharacterized protein n=1 Tax=Colletotrichum aenigma TaxID=1215731 RepID=UPI0018730D4A|nr:uncharacterized protein CGCA056_v014950 [Colletotrichum aenigma]KAF5500013.1 hypothetical protein CGCA056_v014950 [Colletotrichum aenigma]